jgi:tetratricopeptide (TPR) repeat protein
MRNRAWIRVGLFCLAVAGAGAASPASSPGRATWARGQQALLDDKTDEAIVLFQQSLREDARLADAHLGLAAAYLTQQRDALAASHLEDYLRLQPDHHAIRGYYADVLLRLGRVDAAEEQLERFVAAIQGNERLAGEHLVDCHSRLMEIARSRDDSYGEHLHRGMALYRLACERATLPADAGGVSPESLLCRAAGELVRAQRQRPDEARPCWYLHLVWSRLGQEQPARRWLLAARDAALLSRLTPFEQHSLTLACHLPDGRPHR